MHSLFRLSISTLKSADSSFIYMSNSSISCLFFRQHVNLSLQSGAFFFHVFSFFSFFFQFVKEKQASIFFFRSICSSNCDLIEVGCFSAFFLSFIKKQKNLTLSFFAHSSLFFFSTLLRYSSVLLFNALLDIFITDLVASIKNNRFFLFYCFLNINKPGRLFLQFNCNEFSAIHSVTSLYYSAN